MTQELLETDAEILTFYKNLYNMNIASFQIRVQKMFDKDTADDLVKQINKFQTPVGCVLRFFVKHMSAEQRSTFGETNSYMCGNTGRLLCYMHNDIFDKRQVVLRKINKILSRKLPRVLRNIVEEYISRHFIEIYESLCKDDRIKILRHYGTSQHYLAMLLQLKN